MARRRSTAAGTTAGARGDRHHQPARDGGGLGPATAASRSTARSCGRTAAPRRAATSCATRVASRRARAHGARARSLLLAARRSSGCCREGGVDAAPARAFGTIDSWLVCKLTGRARDRRLERVAHAAVRHPRAATGTPSCARCRRARRRSPSRCPSAGVYGDDRRARRHRVPVAGIAGDQQAALFGQACHAPGHGKNTYGTGSFVLDEHGRRARRPRADGLLTTVAWGVGGRAWTTRSRRRSSSPARRCSGCATGSASSRPRPTPRRWRARSTATTASMVPAFTGLGAPHWDPYARGTIVGLTRGTGARAPRTRGARGDRLPDGRRRARDGGRRGGAARGAKGRREVHQGAHGGFAAGEQVFFGQVPAARPGDHDGERGSVRSRYSGRRPG